jgi:hypothetical protein
MKIRLAVPTFHTYRLTEWLRMHLETKILAVCPLFGRECVCQSLRELVAPTEQHLFKF